MDLTAKSEVKALLMKIADDSELREVLWKALVKDDEFARAMTAALRRAKDDGA